MRGEGEVRGVEPRGCRGDQALRYEPTGGAEERSRRLPGHRTEQPVMRLLITWRQSARSTQ